MFMSWVQLDVHPKRADESFDQLFQNGVPWTFITGLACVGENPVDPKATKLAPVEALMVSAKTGNVPSRHPPKNSTARFIFLPRPKCNVCVPTKCFCRRKLYYPIVLLRYFCTRNGFLRI